MYLYIYAIKLPISDCACCHGNNRMNLVSFHKSAYTGSYSSQPMVRALEQYSEELGSSHGGDTCFSHQ